MKPTDEHSFLYGIQPVSEALNSDPCLIKNIFVCKGIKNPKLEWILAESWKKGIPVSEMEKKSLEKKFEIVYHQGVVGLISAFQYSPIEDLVQKAFQKTPSPAIALLDGITDPGNLGGVIRSAEALGIQGIVIPKNRSASISPAVYKRSAGSVYHFPISRVVNFPQTIEYLKKEKFWIIGTDADAGTPLWDRDMGGPIAVVMGSEDKGLRRLTSKLCDFSISIPMEGKTKSLNVASAASIIFYEIIRQRKSPR